MVVGLVEAKIKSQFRVVVGLLFCSLKGKNAVSQPKAVFSPFKEQKQPHDHPKV